MVLASSKQAIMSWLVDQRIGLAPLSVWGVADEARQSQVRPAPLHFWIKKEHQGSPCSGPGQPQVQLHTSFRQGSVRPTNISNHRTADHNINTAPISRTKSLQRLLRARAHLPGDGVSARPGDVRQQLRLAAPALAPQRQPPQCLALRTPQRRALLPSGRANKLPEQHARIRGLVLLCTPGRAHTARPGLGRADPRRRRRGGLDITRVMVRLLFPLAIPRQTNQITELGGQPSNDNKTTSHG